MANEPERPIEKLLRDCARKRREEAPDAPGFELHPATRRLLQGEVARRFPQRGEAGKGVPWRWVGPFWPKLVEACVLVALVAVVGALLVPALRKPKGELTLAKNEASGSAPSLAKSLPAPAAPAPMKAGEELKLQPQGGLVASADAPALQPETPASRLESNRVGVDKDAAAVGGSLAAGARRAPMRSLAQNDSKLDEGAATAPAAAAAPPPAAVPAVPPERSPAMPASPAGPTAGGSAIGGPNLGLADNKSAGSLSNALGGSSGASGFAYRALKDGLNSNAPASLADSSGASVTSYADDTKKTEALGILQRFAQVPPPSKAKAAPQTQAAASVLTSFEVEQKGRELRVIDSDGSVYAGYVQELDATTRAQSFDRVVSEKAQTGNAPMRQQAPLAAPAPSLGQPVRFFRVAGTNRSLEQRVVFSGTLSSLTNATVTAAYGSVAPGQAGTSLAAPGQPGSGPLLNSRISGKVVVGGGKPIELDAVPAP
jgi:hypothetical protein